ncbi:hypothetical protein POM88_039850 [Heracleum sosnowskyi]|uniref:Uncharacterized protein n=1 Tax=Heracleum sosnowskyi TaxID=360622 RepID=A0AAD8HDF6_9APIA|nr:hypothetical protein POM88_039850 [Heracleum sosnowskyi]
MVPMGPEQFHGKVIHSMDYAAMDNETAAKLIKGKKVTVVGLRKSALDIAMECSSANGISHPRTPGEGFLLALLATILSALRWGISKFVESYIKWKLQLEKFGMVPKRSYIREISNKIYQVKIIQTRITLNELLKMLPQQAWWTLQMHCLIDLLQEFDNHCNSDASKFYPNLTIEILQQDSGKLVFRNYEVTIWNRCSKLIKIEH